MERTKGFEKDRGDGHEMVALRWVVAEGMTEEMDTRWVGWLGEL